MKQVDKKTFYHFFWKLPHVQTHTIGDFPYEWHVKQNGLLIAKSVNRILDESEEEYMPTDYFIIDQK